MGPWRDGCVITTERREDALSLVNDSLPVGPAGALAPAGPRVLFLLRTIKADAGTFLQVTS